MSKKRVVKVVVGFAIISMCMYLLYIQIKDDTASIEEKVSGFNYKAMDIDIEFVEDRYAIAFYYWGTPIHTKTGVVELKKTLFGWKIVKAESDRLTYDDWPLEASIMAVYNELSESVVLRGRVVVSDIGEIQIETKDGTRYEGSDIKITDNYLWYFITQEDVDLTGATITVVSEDGKVENKLFVDDEWNIHY
jgi:hypothetical protein